MDEARTAPQGADDEPAPEEGTGSLYFSRSSGLALYGMVLAGAFLFFATTQASDGVTRVLLWACAAFGAWLVLLGVNSWTAVYADRLERGTWRGSRVVLPFTDLREATLREELQGRVVLRLVPRSGKVHSWSADSGSDKRASLPLKVLVDALIAAGVEVDSRNYMGTGPYRLWWHATPPRDDA